MNTSNALYARVQNRIVPKRLGLVLCLLMLALLLLQNRAYALTIDIVGGTESGVPIAIVPFENEDRASDSISQIVAANLSRSGLFAPLERSAMPGFPATPDQLRVDNWRAGRAQYVVIGSLQRYEQGFRAEFHLLDVTRGDWLLGRRISAPVDGVRQIAHRISDIVYEEITGERGAFTTRIAYVKEQGQPGDKTYTLQIADADGANPVTILTSKYPIMSPTWSPDGQQLAYVSFEGNRSGIWVQDLGGYRYQLTSYPGINGAPAWSPDGGRIAVALSKGENPNIYVIDLETRQVEQITRERGIDTEPDWLPDGSGLIFTSNRFGSPQV
ncbi:MAG TPA: Tol-Pal system protein TolB, partial [Halothiobacillaceae bacterium]|nr:Tol-Pal system protein TolB [Halothiobacillaceae bacterium]